MNWELGYTASIYIKIVDSGTWNDTDRIEITGGSVQRVASGLLETASVDCINYDQSAERWIRIWMDVRQDGASAHVPVFTGLAVAPQRDINDRLSKNALECYSVLKPSDDVLLPLGWYAPASANGAQLIGQLLEPCPAPKVIPEDAPLLTNAIVAENNESNLTMIWRILDAIDWRIRTEGDGTIHVEPKPTEASAAFDASEYDVIEPELSTVCDWYSCPNVFRAVQAGQSAIARDEDTDNPFSIPSRGREIWASESNVKLGSGESLQMYANRRLKELQNAVLVAQYDRRYHPDVFVGDLVRLHYPEQGLDGLFRVTSQSIDLERSGRTSEVGEKYEDITD